MSKTQTIKVRQAAYPEEVLNAKRALYKVLTKCPCSTECTCTDWKKIELKIGEVKIAGSGHFALKKKAVKRERSAKRWEK